MKRSSSYLVVIVILMFGYSCKSEVKSPNMEAMTTETKTEKETPAVNAVPVLEGNTNDTNSNAATEAKTPVQPSKQDVSVKSAKNTPSPSKTGSSKTTTPKSPPTNVIQAKDIVITQPVVTNASVVKNPNKSQDTKPSSDVISEVKEKVNEEVVTKVDPEIKPEKEPTKPKKIETAVLLPDHKPFDQLLKKHVSANGEVDYKGLKANVSQLEVYLKSLESYKVDNSWSKNEKLAFWINAYNAYTIKLILDNYGLQSITDLHRGKPWDHKWINLNGSSLSLNNIENDIIRPKFNEPRIHFAVNCAAQSCPPIMNGAFTSKNLNSQLESQTKKFINNVKFNTLGKDEITISKIFDWYGKDFGDVASFIAKYANTSVSPKASIKYNEYDWALNGK